MSDFIASTVPAYGVGARISPYDGLQKAKANYMFGASCVICPALLSCWLNRIRGSFLIQSESFYIFCHCVYCISYFVSVLCIGYMYMIKA